MKVNGKILGLSLVMLIFGFIIAFSYQITKNEERPKVTNEQWKKEDQLRTSILAIQKENRRLQSELQVIQEKLHDKEELIAQQESVNYELVEQLNNLRKVAGKISVHGPGITVTLSDSNYIPSTDNPNNYIVHEEHVQKVIYELNVSGAEAISINGQRIPKDTYIACIGPVISINGVQHPAPFKITAIGDSEVMAKSINLTGGVVDHLVNDGVQVKIETENDITIPPYLSQKG